MRRTIAYGDATIAFTICFTPRVSKRVAIHVMPDGAVRVDAPEHAALAEVMAAVRKRARWIWSQLDAQGERKRHVLPREYVSGESHFYLGRRYMLQVRIDPAAEPGVKLWRGRLAITAPAQDAALIRRLLDAWYRSRGLDMFARIIAACAARAPWLKQAPSWRLRNMRTQWGSCSPKGELLLNPHLLKAPRACIEYVVIHELCHLKEHNHGANFYRLLGAMLPDWEARKKELDDLAELLLNR